MQKTILLSLLLLSSMLAFSQSQPEKVSEKSRVSKAQPVQVKTKSLKNSVPKAPVRPTKKDPKEAEIEVRKTSVDTH